MLKILYISHLHPPIDAPLENMGGMQRVSMQLLHELENRDDVEVYPVLQHVKWKGVEVRTFFFLSRLLFSLPKMVKEFKPDVILFSSMVTASLARLLRNKIDVPMVTINHGQDVTLPIKTYQQFVPQVFEALDSVISVSRATKQACIDRGMDKAKGKVLPNGFNVADFGELPDKIEARKRLKAHFDIDFERYKLLITVGRKVKRKGHAWFINEVLPKIKTDSVYLTVGVGPEFENIQELSISKNSDKHPIILAGKQPDEVLKLIYAAADLFVMPNISVPGDMEGFGVVMLEANIAGTPAIASGLEGILDVVTDGKNGYLIEPGDAIDFANRIDQTLNTQLDELSAKSKQFVSDHFAWNKVVNRYVEHLKKVTQNK